MSFTARMSASLPDDLAMSTTHIPDTNSTFAVVYGCNDEQMGDIERRIRKADGQFHHPLLIPGIFAELERTRLVEMAENLLDVFALRSERLNSASKADPWSPESDADGKRTQEHLNLCMGSRDLVSHISAVKRQMAKLLKEMSVVEREIESLRVDNMPREHMREPGLVDTGTKMRTRVEDILIEYDDKIDDCNMMICNMSLAMQTVWNHIARQDSKTNTKISQANAAIAVQTKVESAQMRTIALLTMIYLPLSSVASIFSMDMFNWEAIEGQTIVSKHIWLFFVLAVGLTLVTVAAWFFGTRREKAMAAKSDEYFNSPQRKNTLEYV
ncbi:Putative corA, transmembrane region [Colletotrichum destructivum]|uniref:CorA, transmembrane region n=1 Tax=Colletotrichum destructivum TaxID=34406 RepID=A0AAX4IKY4_9PEZI|nr:Putative corA, transmembrane region [Colletotrichum destructivum]